MARKLRVQYPGAIYHLMNRGGRRALALDDKPGANLAPQCRFKRI